MLKQLRGVLLLPIVIPCICLFIIFVAVCEVLKTGSEHQYLVPVFQEHQLIINIKKIPNLFVALTSSFPLVSSLYR